ncbi:MULTISPECIES: hypothetical protein [unclassified Planococcus (in: firmicutes)]|uniref:hypothetical protein n=1 Tax=unclassified Planococcus (in: firmicutes) TaxID=2662419 RepID=UPI000C345747|nr:MULTISPECIES: hypothetical protein [unclassified Planococcus (in: firmicutes)]AUD15187.1 hypothetical protein CW734_17725 [Planococcus sp. MB-3u-03]PKG46319.1 hypothetical protein CXF66_08025 [Planococcus sp. Urea-trap-24]PKG90105.1 hypothetical protein CXF91_04370 [Planococcus sp. Urea-3u-39]PKH35817.1 hypothetical protein CXF77_16800 [Planococcus sp. MB-3u-09]
MPKRKSFYKKSLSAGILGSALFIAGCGTADTIAEQQAESEQAEVQTTTASDGSGETEQSEDETEEAEETEETEETAEEAEEGAEAETAATDAEEQAVPEDQQGITMPMPLGTPLDDLIAHYGEPTYDDYFLGSRLVMFKEKDGYFLDDDNNAKGFLVGNPDVSVFDTRVGMTFEEIDEILGAKGEVGYDQSETQYYLNIYYVENYKITYSAETEDGPVVDIVIIRSK